MLRLLTLVLFFYLPAIASSQNIVYVNNNPGTAANFNSLQQAVDNVPTGTIIMLQPSQTSYGIVTVNKPVSIIGSGYFLGMNPAPFTQASTSSSIITSMYFSNGAQGSFISGLNFSGPFVSSTNRLSINGVSNITITRCYFNWQYGWPNQVTLNCAYIENATNIFFNQNFFDCPGEGFIAATNSIGNIQYNNNIMRGGALYFLNPYGNGMSVGSVSYTNNTFYSNANSFGFHGANYNNNVLMIDLAGDPSISSGMNAANNNVSNKNIFPGGQNITNATIADLVYFSSDASIISHDGRMQLKPGSVAIGYGAGGIDAGAFGGTNPYVLSGIPMVPNIYAAEILNPATTGGGLKIRLKIRANN